MAAFADLHGDRQDVKVALLGQFADCRTYRLGRLQWAEHAARLERVARTTGRAGLRRWASWAAQACRVEEERARIQDEENRMDD